MANRNPGWGGDPGRSNRTFERDQIFFAGLAEGWSIGKSAAAAGYSRRSVHDYRKADPEFAACWDAAHAMGSDTYEDEANRRGKDGVTRDIYYKGEVVGAMQEYSDTMLKFVMAARDPLKYGNLARSAQGDEDPDNPTPGATTTIIIKGGLPKKPVE